VTQQGWAIRHDIVVFLNKVCKVPTDTVSIELSSSYSPPQANKTAMESSLTFFFFKTCFNASHNVANIYNSKAPSFGGAGKLRLFNF
jgi:hypothetical protein